MFHQLFLAEIGVNLHLICDRFDATIINQTCHLFAVEIGDTDGTNETFNDARFHRFPSVQVMSSAAQSKSILIFGLKRTFILLKTKQTK